MLRPMLPLLFIAMCAPALAAEPRVIEVTLDSYSFKPDKITVKAGEPVILKLKNEATLVPHNLVIEAPQAGVDVKLDVSAGKSGEVSFTPTLAGSYPIVCDKAPPFGKSHKEKGMHGTLIVE
jgi:plastocyanin